MSDHLTEPNEKIQGYIERITFQSEENGFTVARLQEKRNRELTTVVGNMPTLQPGETIQCKGSWKRDPKHGLQFSVFSYETVQPSDSVGIRKYLSSGLIKGIGPAYAERIVEKFGISTLDVIDQTPEKLLEISGIGEKRYQQIIRCWSEHKAIREVMIFLQKYEVSSNYAQKIYRTYGEGSIARVTENPFLLARDVSGIGFKTADRIAAKMGMAKDASVRVQSGIEYLLSELSNDGHVCFPEKELAVEAQQMLEVSEAQVASELIGLEAEERIAVRRVREEGIDCSYVWLMPLFRAELGIAREIQRLMRARCILRGVDTSKAIEWVQEELNFQLEENQACAVAEALQNKMQIITGGPGTGKSTITKAILRITEMLSPEILLAAPTGRAAKRMTEITRRQAKTIHSLLEFDFRVGKFKRDRDNPLECSLLIVDEASMIDTLLMNRLLRAVPDHARVIFVGDVNQLPSVGPGNVLRDLIDSCKIPVTCLTQIFRQARGSRIIVNAHRILSGSFPYLKNRPDGDFFFIDAEDKGQLLQHIVSLVSERLPAKYQFDPLEDIQVLSPMKRGEVGTENINAILQERINPSSEPLLRWGRRYHVHDKVMQMRNNYKKEVYNGDVGKISHIDFPGQTVAVIIDGKEISYDFAELDELQLAYAVSIHKYQGSECPCVIIPVHTTHFKMLHRNLLYTAVTRGKKLVVLVGMKKAIAVSVHNNEVAKRYTGLLRELEKMQIQ